MRRVTTVLLTLVGILLAGSHYGWASQQEKPKVTRLSEQSPGPITFPKIDRKPKPEEWGRGEMKSVPKYDPDSDDPFRVDLRGYDLSKLDLGNSIDDLLYASFDDRTVWPASDKMPHDFTWQKFMELGKNPGLGIRSLHKKGITGRGVRIAILDQPLLVDHQEYVERVRLYEEIHIQSGEGPSMHGAAVASIAVGKTVGVAPEAELFYIAQWNFDWEKKKFTPTLRYLAQGIHRMLEINEQLPQGKKIRVISISKGWEPSDDGCDDIMAACEEAKAAGIFVVSCSLDRVYGFSFAGLGRNPLASPDLFESYEPGLFWAKGFYNGRTGFGSGYLLVPMDSRTTASPVGSDEYVFHRQGGMSWSVPYIAGVYTLAVQVEPEITPERFWKLAIKTGRTIELEHKGERRSFGLIIDPVRLIRAIQAGETATLNGQQSDTQPAETHPQTHSETQTIVPGVGVGDYTFDMSKDEVLKRLGKPKMIFFGGETYTLNNLPRRYFMFFGDISFGMDDDAVTGIGVHSPLYKFTNGLGVGDSEQKIKQAFGDDFHLEEAEWKDFLIYEDQGLQFEIHKKNRTVMEIAVNQTTGDHGESTEALTPSTLEPFDNVGGKDLRAYDLRSAGAILDTLEFDQETVWPTPDRLPEGFDPNALLQEGMNPGLGVRALHAEGITGAGVHVGLIDQPLLLDHPEYAGKIVSYHDAGCGPSMSSMHGPGMASQLVGKRCGTAPGAKLHVVAVPSWKADADYYARALDRLVTRNREVRKDRKIRVVSVSAQPSGEGSNYANQSLWDRAVERAQANGILVLDCTWHHGFVSLCWLDPQNRESVEACTPGFRNGSVEVDKGHIHVPSAPRTTAEAPDERPYGYAYDGGGRRSSRPMSKGGYSDTIPYAAGILALGWQIRPDLTPTQMREMLLASAYVHKSGARIIHPTAFIELIRKQNDNQEPDRSSKKDGSTLVRQAAAQGRILFKRTTPAEFKAIAGQPTKEWTYEDGEVIYMEYPGVEVKFFGKPELNTPHTVLYVLCEGREIDIGQNRPIPLDLEKFDSIRGVRSKDLSRFDLSQQGERLKALSFDSHTVWPESDRLPPDFDPEAIMEWGKNPGLGIKQLHDQGVTGKGVQVAIIDQPLLVDHIEYASQLAGYTEIQTGDADPQMHGAGVASLLVGKTCGAAPGALLHFWAEPSWKRDYKYRCIALEQIIQFNRGKERAEQIRILSVSKGFSRDEPNLDRWKTLLEKARQSGIYVVHCGSMGFGAGCRFLKDSDNPANYRLCAFYQRGPVFHESGAFFTPIDHRTTASQNAKDAYTFYPVGGLSWGAPYYAGVVALGMQVNPDLRVDQIDKLLYESGWDFQRGRLINPIGFVEAARRASSKGPRSGRRR